LLVSVGVIVCFSSDSTIILFLFCILVRLGRDLATGFRLSQSDGIGSHFNNRLWYTNHPVVPSLFFKEGRKGIIFVHFTGREYAGQVGKKSGSNICRVLVQLGRKYLLKILVEVDSIYKLLLRAYQ